MRAKNKRPTTIDYFAVGMVTLALTTSALLVGEQVALEGTLRTKGIFPDYIIESIDVRPSALETGQHFRIDAFIKNIGPASATHRTYAELRIDEWNNKEWDIVGTRQVVPPLPPNTIYPLTWTSNGPAPSFDWKDTTGTHRLRICAVVPTSERDYSLTEGNGGNNCTEQVITITPHAAAK